MKKIPHVNTEQTRNRILKAIKDLSGLISITLGPGGRTILLDQENRPPLATKDGATVARHFQGSAPLEDMVSKMAIEICERTVRDAGDGTTTAIVLGAALVEEGQKFLAKNPQYSPQRLARELKDIFNSRIKPEILLRSVSIRDLPKEESRKAIEHVALISANGDLEISKSVAEAVEGVGEDGICIAEEGAGTECRVSFDSGFSFNSGLSDLGGSAGPSFVNRSDMGDCVVEGTYVCLYDGEINDIGTILPVMQRVGSEVDCDGRAVKSPLVVFAHRFSDQVLKMMAQNFRRGTLTVVPIKTVRNGQENGPSEFLHDMSCYTGARVFDAQGAPLSEAQLANLGFCETLKFGRNEGVMIGKPDLESIETRIADLKKQMAGMSEFDQEKIRYRIGRLTGGVATIYAGGKTQLEAKERHARVIDAICSVRSALQEGVIPGGGVTLARIGYRLEREEGPVSIFAEALQKPFRQIMENADCKEVAIGGLGFGPFAEGAKEDFQVYDALKREVVGWWWGGIMDPTKVALSALENALSVAQLLMTLGGAIVLENSEGREQVMAMQEGLLKAINEEALG